MLVFVSKSILTLLYTDALFLFILIFEKQIVNVLDFDSVHFSSYSKLSDRK